MQETDEEKRKLKEVKEFKKTKKQTEHEKMIKTKKH